MTVIRQVNEILEQHTNVGDSDQSTAYKNACQNFSDEIRKLLTDNAGEGR